MAAKNGAGDDYRNRLLSYLKNQFIEPIEKVIPIRDSVYLIHTPNHSYVIKGYQKYKKLRLQETFTTTLHQEGFEKTYLFLEDMFKEPAFFEGEYFGCMEYIEPNVKEFSYHSHRNRKEGLALLNKFHSVTAAFANRYKTLIPNSDILSKWKSRLKRFRKYQSKIRYYLEDQYIEELLDWSKWSLNGMDENESFFYQKPHAVLHGDVAHHNFLRDRTGTLNLIDFDLIGIGPPSLDILQYANRILPHLDWSLANLARYEEINKYLTERAFLYALAFPTDILREWNRTMREGANERMYRQVLELTMDQFYLRRKFFNELRLAVKSLE